MGAPLSLPGGSARAAPTRASPLPGQCAFCLSVCLSVLQKICALNPRGSRGGLCLDPGALSKWLQVCRWGQPLVLRHEAGIRRNEGQLLLGQKVANCLKRPLNGSARQESKAGV